MPIGGWRALDGITREGIGNKDKPRSFLMNVATIGTFRTRQQLYSNDGGCMTVASFLNELRAIRSAYQWFLTKDGRIRATVGADRTNRVFDPITAVVFAKTGQFFPEPNWSKAAMHIGLGLEDCAELVSAFNFDWDPSSRQGTMRHDLLEALMMTPQATREIGLVDVPMFTPRKPGNSAV